MIDGDHFRDGSLCQFGSDASDVLAGHCDLDRHGATGELLRGGNGLEARPIELAVFLFSNDENHRTRASSRSRLTSSLAASAGEPVIITVCLDFCGA